MQGLICLCKLTQHGIVYCLRRKGTIDLAHKFKLENMDALSDADRKKYEHA